MNIEKLPLHFFVRRFIDREPFAYVRYGDGEWNSILGIASGALNADGHKYYKGMGLDLAETLTKPRDYYYAIGPKAYNSQDIGKAVQKFIAKRCPKIKWHSTETFLNCSLRGHLYPLIDSLRQRKVMVVGPAHLRRLEEQTFVPQCFVETPLPNAYLEKERIKKEIERKSSECTLISFSCGFVAKRIIWELYPELKSTHALIDFGSLWDVYCGVTSRKYAQDIKLAKFIRAANLGHSYDDKLSAAMAIPP